MSFGPLCVDLKVVRGLVVVVLVAIGRLKLTLSSANGLIRLY